MRATLAVISAGGVLGALARYGLGEALPHAPSAFPWATLLVNLTGCLLIGALMAAIELRPAHRLLRPFLGVGVLGGYTTFSTYAVDVRLLAGAGRIGLALGYLAVTVLGALLATYLGSVAMKAVIGP